MAGSRRSRNQAAPILARQNSVSEASRPRQTLSPELLASMNKEQLRAECRKRGQKSTGNKNELLSRLGYYKLANSTNSSNSQSEQNGSRTPNGLHPQPIMEVRSKPSQTEVDQGLVLWRKPLLTLEYFFKELFILCTNALQRLLSYKAALASFGLVVAMLLTSYYVEGPHQQHIHSWARTWYWCVYWMTLGVLSSVGLGTGLHTFLLYLGPHIARVTLAAYECRSLDFPQPPYPDRIICPSEVNPNAVVTIWDIMSKVRLECMMWGVGTALGELPPYFMARAAALAGKHDPNHTTSRSSRWMSGVVSRCGFAGILACASVPNPLFDLAGLTCGHFLVPFRTFFGATLLGKAVVKMHIQKMFVIIAFNDELITQFLIWIKRFPYVGPKLEEPLLEFLRNQKSRLHNGGDGSEGGSGSSPLAAVLETFVLVMVVYFVVSIVHALAHNYARRPTHNKKAKRLRE